MDVNSIFNPEEDHAIEALASEESKHIVAIDMSELLSIDMSSIDGGNEEAISMADYMQREEDSGSI